MGFRSNDSKSLLSDELKIRSWNRADSALFDAVNSTFWLKIEKFGFKSLAVVREKRAEARAKKAKKSANEEDSQTHIIREMEINV